MCRDFVWQRTAKFWMAVVAIGDFERLFGHSAGINLSGVTGS
jgi:hypothetical protein